MTPTSKSPLAEVQAEVKARISEADALISQAEGKVKAAQVELNKLLSERGQLLDVLKAAGGQAAGKGKRLSPEARRAQLVDLVGSTPGGATKSQIVEGVGLSAIYVQNLLKELRDEGVLRSEKVAGAGNALRWFKK